MAEILLKIGEGAGFEDGDVLCAFSDHHIRCVHAEHHCHLDHAGKTRDGLRPAESLAAHLREAVCQYRFERVSRTEVQRVNLWTGEVTEHQNYWFDVVSQDGVRHPQIFASTLRDALKVANRSMPRGLLVLAEPERTPAGVQGHPVTLLPDESRITQDAGWLIGSGGELDVDLFLKRRLQHKRHAIFGRRGREVWYGGREDRSEVRVARVWEKIAEKTGRLHTEEEHRLWPMGRLDIRHHLAVRSDDFTAEEAAAMVAPQLELDGDGKPVVDDDGKPRVLAKRNVRVNWRRDLLDDLGVTEREVVERGTPVGRDVVMSNGKVRHESKPQPTQRDRGKLHDKAAGKPIQERNR